MTNLPALREADPIALGDVMHKSGMFPDTKSAAAAVVKILAGQEYGLGPVAAMSGIHVIDNKPVPGATVLAGCVKRHPAYDFRVKTHDAQSCVLEFFELGGGAREMVGVSSFTFEDAKRAGLSGRTNWQRYPRNMLFARALSNGVRWYCPDVVMTGVILTAEEAADEADVEYAPPGAAPEPVRNEAAALALPAARITEAQVREIADLYRRAQWKEDAEADPHKILRWQLGILGVPGGAPGEPLDLISALTETQYVELRTALENEARRAEDFAAKGGEPA